jgi:Ca2+-binding RTX toxin-like protein
VTIYGGGGGDQIAGGSGNDVMFAGSGNDDIYGNAGFNLDLSQSLAQSVASGTPILSVVDDPAPGESPTADPLSASSQTIFAGSGNDIIIGHHGVIAQAPGTDPLLTTGAVTSVYSIDPWVSANDQIYGGSGSAIVIAGNGNDLIDLAYAGSGAPNVVIADDGVVDFAAPVYFTSVGGWFSNLALVASSDPQYGGSDRVVTGSGPAVIIGGAGNNFIQTGGGALIIGNEGFVVFSGGRPSKAISTDP